MKPFLWFVYSTSVTDAELSDYMTIKIAAAFSLLFVLICFKVVSKPEQKQEVTP